MYIFMINEFKWKKYMLNMLYPRERLVKKWKFTRFLELRDSEEKKRNFYILIKEICEKIFATDRRDKTLIISSLYKELTSATGMKWNRIEDSEADSGTFENLVHQDNGILNLLW